MLTSVKSALALLDRRSQRILLVLVLVQIFIASLDLLGVLLFGLVAALSASAIAGETSQTLSQVLNLFGLTDADEVYLAIVLAAAAGLVFIIKSVLTFLLVRRSLRFLANRQAMVSSRLAERLLSRPLIDVQRNSSQQNAYALTSGANAATLGILGNAVVMVAEFALLLVMAVGLLAIDPLVAVFTIVFFAGLGLIMNRALGNWARRLGKQLATAEIASFTSVQDALRTYRETTVSGRRTLFVERFQGLRWRAAKYQADSQIMIQVSKYVFEVGLIIGGAALAVSQVLTRELVAAVAVIAVFLTAASRIMPALLRLQQASLGIRQASGIAEPTFRLNEDLESAIEEFHIDTELRRRVLDGLASDHAGFEPALSLKGVSVTYPGADRPAIDGADVHLGQGESLALVGPTGAGKSTVADLVLGVLEPDQGSVVVSGVSPNAAVSTWPGAMAYVPQEVIVLNGTIRDNVALGLPSDSINDDAVWQALERAHLADMLRAEREGLDTLVGEHGVRLSGGQRQRLGLARALYTRPRFMVLDEATSALDAETERAVTDALQELEGEVTLVIVAHRLATIRHCSQVVYIEEGRILSRGTFDEVRAAQPNFDRQAQLLGL
ncbi:ABC transporter ATP-binding protein/permease [Candidatus Nanopelagicales bacterium]|nr:ABC transporter ATP-binding protein/permease [Candidatus Nanopelagicales bacterium]